MDKKDRQIFSEIEKMIVNSKMECLAAIPKNQVYNDFEIKNRLKQISSNLSDLDKKIERLETQINIPILFKHFLIAIAEYLNSIADYNDSSNLYFNDSIQKEYKFKGKPYRTSLDLQKDYAKLKEAHKRLIQRGLVFNKILEEVERLDKEFSLVNYPEKKEL